AALPSAPGGRTGDLDPLPLQAREVAEHGALREPGGLRQLGERAAPGERPEQRQGGVAVGGHLMPSAGQTVGSWTSKAQSASVSRIRSAQSRATRMRTAPFSG